MQAIVLVGGEGTRLRPLTYGTPKPMVPIMNVPFLARTMERLYEAGIRDVILPAGYMPQAIVDYFGDGSTPRPEDHLRDRGDPARNRRRDQERRAAHHRAFLRPQRRHSHEPRPRRDAPIPRGKGRHRHVAPHTGRRSLGLRLRRPRRRRAGRCVRRETAQGSGADQRHQCRNLPARAGDSRREFRPGAPSRSSAKRSPR